MLVKKAGMVVLGAAAGMVALTPAAFAGNAPDGPHLTSSDSGSRGGDHGGDRGQQGGQRHHGHRGHHHGGKDHGGGAHHGHHGHHGHPRSGGHDGAEARNGDCANFGNQLVGANCTNVQAPINQPGVLSSYRNG